MPGRLCDIDLVGGTRTMASGWTSPYLTHHPIFTSAAEAVTALRAWNDLNNQAGPALEVLAPSQRPLRLVRE